MKKVKLFEQFIAEKKALSKLDESAINETRSPKTKEELISALDDAYSKLDKYNTKYYEISTAPGGGSWSSSSKEGKAALKYKKMAGNQQANIWKWTDKLRKLGFEYNTNESSVTEKREDVGEYNTVKKVVAELGRRPSEQDLATFINDNYYDVTEVERGEDDPRANDKIADLVAFYKFDIDDWEIAWEDAQNESIVTENSVTFTLDDGDLDDKFLSDKSLSRNLDYKEDGRDTYYVLPKRDFDRLQDWADSSGYDTDEVIEVIEESVVNEASKDRMIKQIKRALKDGTAIFKLPMDTQNYYRKNKGDFESAVTEVNRSFVSGTSARAVYSLEARKYELKKDVKGARIGDFTDVTLPKGTIIHNLPGGVFADHFSLKQKYTSKYSSRSPQWNDKFGIMVRSMPETLEAIETNSKVLESAMTEALSKSDRKAIAYTMAEQDPEKVKDLQNAIGQDFSDNYSSTNRSVLVDVKKKGGKWVAITKETESKYNSKKPKKGEREATIGITWNAMFF